MSPTVPSPPPLSILVVDDEAIVRESLGAWFREDGYAVETATGAREALRAVAGRRFDVAFVDIRMPGMDGLELQKRLAAASPDTTVVMITAFASVETAVGALKAGAWDYIVKPFDPDELSHLVRRLEERRALRDENRRLRSRLDEVSGPSEIVGASAAMERVRGLVATVAPTDATVLVRGESGTGKELVAAALHAASPRRYNPMVVVHCGALAEGVLESELFGHEKGAFTGASFHHKGKFEQADGGTVFLDEIGDIGPRVQVDLLRVLEEKRVTRVGGRESVPVDFRVVAATNRDLAALVREGGFREDLYYRLNVVVLEVPPLRERPEDIPLLARHFLDRFARAMNRRAADISPAALEALRAHSWPGNARELQNAIERAVVFSRGPVLEPEDLPLYVREGPRRPAARSLSEVEREHIARILAEAGGNMTRAARILGVDRGTLYHKVRRYGIERPVDAG